MAYYHDLVTEQSWNELKNLRSVCDFSLLGGWAVYLYTRSLKSKDIDILVDYDQLPLLQKKFEFIKNVRLHKYEAIKGPVQIDIYTPHYSQLGIPVEILLDNSQVIDGFRVVNPEYLILLKLYTLSQRGRTPKGRKDFLDLLSLSLALKQSPFISAVKLIHQHQLERALTTFAQFLAENTQIPELSLNSHQYSVVKKSLTSSLT